MATSGVEFTAGDLRGIYDCEREGTQAGQDIPPPRDREPGLAGETLTP